MVERKLVERMVPGNDTSAQDDTSIDFEDPNLESEQWLYQQRAGRQTGGGVCVRPRQISD